MTPQQRVSATLLALPSLSLSHYSLQLGSLSSIIVSSSVLCCVIQQVTPRRCLCSCSCLRCRLPFCGRLTPGRYSGFELFRCVQLSVVSCQWSVVSHRSRPPLFFSTLPFSSLLLSLSLSSPLPLSLLSTVMSDQKVPPSQSEAPSTAVDYRGLEEKVNWLVNVMLEREEREARISPRGCDS